METNILLIGIGNLGGKILDLLVHMRGIGKITIAGRNEERLLRRKNLSLFAALQLEHYPEIEHIKMDLLDVDHTAETLSRLKPDIIFNAATLRTWRASTAALPKEVAAELSQAQLGPWLPMHLTLMHKLMLAIKKTSMETYVVNAAFPDAVHPVLDRLNLAPTIGIGHVGNIIPALRKSIAYLLRRPVEKVEVLFVAQHYITHFIPRFGYPDAPCHLRAIVDGSDVTGDLDPRLVYSTLSKRFARVGGAEGQILTATSAAKILEAMVNNTRELAHAPGPNGLPGGYPVKVDAQGGAIWLPENLPFEEAIRINEEGQRADGVDRIDADGAVHFTDESMRIMKRVLGYECKTMKVAESEGYAEELRAKLDELTKKHAPSP
uniref:Saccharopine dehydrogenase NADP binding domain-containing protein n=1 Tax=Candidatus Kentrum sp. TC TaxID=2126339 RepID=A0A450YYX8_9GAMM|nr:MAG: hypothetical protein BECKTC1821E_GA0114239_102320 [Candidatus Kentron sp. TC]VFK46726.1 MAG: hypothetical protein BECKTC1821D_GA0114238_10356 [Candidatus Kentron sp. TC]